MVGSAAPPAVLLVSSGSAQLDWLEPVEPLIPNLRLELCRDQALVPSLLDQEEFALVLVHVSEDFSAAAVKELLWAVAHLDRPVATVLVFDECDEITRAEYLRAGAACCVQRAINPRKLARVLETLTAETRALPLENGEAVKPDVIVADPDPSFYVLSPQMAQLMEQVRRVVPQETPILFTGETGTGKTRMARLIHEMSPRRTEPFLVVDCNALSPSLIESELFGHVKGAFTSADRDRPGKFAAVGRGTLVLDEINSLPLPLQSKLLRVVDDRVFEPVGSNKSHPLRARLITISNAPLEQEVAAGRFRPDLYYRLNVVGFYLPPLRDRINAIGPLAQKFVAQFAAGNRPERTSIAPEALRALERYPWPGNIRELGNVIERAVTLFAGPRIELSHLPEALRAHDSIQNVLTFGSSDSNNQRGIALPNHLDRPLESLTLTKTKEKAEVLRITEALRKHQNNRLRAARELGISRMALYKKLHKYGLHSTG